MLVARSLPGLAGSCCKRVRFLQSFAGTGPVCGCAEASMEVQTLSSALQVESLVSLTPAYFKSLLLDLEVANVWCASPVYRRARKFMGSFLQLRQLKRLK